MHKFRTQIEIEADQTPLLGRRNEEE